ncbi:MAG: proton-conducting membrane transporter [Lachnospiraceae bacterium]|nr:proton-conducting membrane transporter [Lachnospiraceae bacterium]
MKETLMFIAVILPFFAGMVFPAIKFRQQKYKEIYIESIVIITSVLVFTFIFNVPQGSFVFARFTRALSLSLKMDGLSVIFGGLVAFLWPFATLYALEYMKNDKYRTIFFMFYTMTYGVTLGIAFSEDLLTMYFFYELLTLVTFPLVMHTLSREAILASRTYLYYSLGGAAFAFIGLVFVITNGATLNFTMGGVLDKTEIPGNENIFLLIYVMSFLGFGVKAAICPFNAWLPKASVAPTPVTALLHAVAVVKAGAFAIIRLTYYSFGTQILKGTWAQMVVMGVTVVTILYGSAMAVKETHFKRRLAYSTISNLSYILFSAAIMTPLGLIGALMHLVIHAFIKITSFFCAGAVIHQTEKNYIHELDGMGYKLPRIFTIFTIASLALMGVPMLPGFVSKWYIAKAAVDSMNTEAYIGLSVIMISSLLTAIYMLSIVARVFFPPKDKVCTGDFKDPGIRMLLPLYVFALVLFVLGLYSKPLADYVRAVVMEVV